MDKPSGPKFAHLLVVWANGEAVYHRDWAGEVRTGAPENRAGYRVLVMRVNHDQVR
jgi:hypothetical protein